MPSLPPESTQDRLVRRIKSATGVDCTIFDGRTVALDERELYHLLSVLACDAEDPKSAALLAKLLPMPQATGQRPGDVCVF